MRDRRRTPLVVLSGWALLGLVITVAMRHGHTPGIVIAVMTGIELPLCFFGTGYLLLPLLVRSESIAVSLRLTLAVVLSMFVTVVGGLILDRTPTGLTRTTWMLWFAAVTLVAAGVTVLRRPCLDGTATGRWTPPTRRSHLPIAGRELMAFSVAGLIAAAAVGISVVGSHRQNLERPPFTAFWVASHAGSNPAGESRATHPTRLATIDIRSHEHRQINYQLDVRLANVRVLERRLLLRPGQNWKNTIAVRSGQQLQANLYLSGQTEPYRKVTYRAPQF